MSVGTRSVLYGAHCFLLHPFFVAWAWWRLYGFPVDPRLWAAFFLHDIGYLGKPNMDGPEGETHPEVGGAIMERIFGRTWGRFTLLHSRTYARQLMSPVSPLCVADKLAFVLTPRWLYLPMVRATGELAEYMAHAHYRADGNVHVTAIERVLLRSNDEIGWHRGVCSYMLRWIQEHQGGGVDTWTPHETRRATQDSDGVWR